MKKKFFILVADRNPRVREFLKREMTAEGYGVLLAKNCEEVVQRIYHDESLDLLIMDPDLPDKGALMMWEKLQARIPPIPVVIHGFLSDYSTNTEDPATIIFIEKSGNSVENIKKAVIEILENPVIQGDGPRV